MDTEQGSSGTRLTRDTAACRGLTDTEHLFLLETTAKRYEVTWELQPARLETQPAQHPTAKPAAKAQAVVPQLSAAFADSGAKWKWTWKCNASWGLAGKLVFDFT